jgi:cell division protein FtsL
LNSRLVLVLIALAAVVGSALGVVHARHESRQHSAELGLLERERDAFIAEWSRLQIEQAYLADAGRVEAEARDKLGMSEPEEPRILVVRP